MKDKRFLALVVTLCPIALVIGCGTPRAITVTPALTHQVADPQAFTLALQQAAWVQAPPPCAGCIGEATDTSLRVPVLVTSAGYAGKVVVTTSGLPATVFMSAPPAPSVILGYDGDLKTADVGLYVLPAAIPGTYSFTIVATPSSGPVVTLPAQLTITPPADAAWKNTGDGR